MQDAVSWTLDWECLERAGWSEGEAVVEARNLDRGDGDGERNGKRLKKKKKKRKRGCFGERKRKRKRRAPLVRGPCTLYATR